MKNFGNTEDHVDTPASELHQRPIIPKYAVLTVLMIPSEGYGPSWRGGSPSLEPLGGWSIERDFLFLCPCCLSKKLIGVPEVRTGSRIFAVRGH